MLLPQEIKCYLPCSDGFYLISSYRILENSGYEFGKYERFSKPLLLLLL